MKVQNLKKLELTKSELIHILKTEPELYTGKFIDVMDNAPTGQCQVCAVGAVLRHMMPEAHKEAIKNIADSIIENPIVPSAQCKKFAKRSLKRGNPFQALSQLFEGLARSNRRPKLGYNGDRKVGRYTKVRKELIKWVEKNFPSKIIATFEE